ncbi:hypothetical protein J437_LFUL019665 [Ladona fulva]|uniref:Uncharacterized protein n=1 Tax=Ladona fulva TaxID=123851 RepID=A0A8K0KUP7_LADFU|nr:hypothetical protein J437_LFUL019665 [Ladona fulva]
MKDNKKTSFGYFSQESSIDLLQTTLELSEEHLSGFLAKFWLKIGAVINAVNNPENKIKNVSPKEMSNLQASLESDISELCMYLKKKCELLKQIKSSLNDSEFHRSLSGLENKLNIKVSVQYLAW